MSLKDRLINLQSVIEEAADLRPGREEGQKIFSRFLDRIVQEVPGSNDGRPKKLMLKKDVARELVHTLLQGSCSPERAAIRAAYFIGRMARTWGMSKEHLAKWFHSVYNDVWAELGVTKDQVYEKLMQTFEAPAPWLRGDGARGGDMEQELPKKFTL